MCDEVRTVIRGTDPQTPEERAIYGIEGRKG